jgi:hypothetical protein
MTEHTENIRERYGPYPKKKEKKKNRMKEGQLFKRTYEWVKWKMADIGSFSFHRPCLEQ